ncbi:MAG: DUF4301 family protein [Pseudomonadota bacterium]
MANSIFSEEDRKQIQSRGMNPDEVASQIEMFKKGFPHAKLRRPCTLHDGILALDQNELTRLKKVYDRTAREGRTLKFVPASGAASRMFKLLLSINNQSGRILKKDVIARAEQGDPDHKTFLRFILGLQNFAFFDDLKAVMSRDGIDIDDLARKGEYKEALEYTLTSKGLGLAALPKGLIPFHRYPARSRTPFEEHLIEASEYTRDKQGLCRVHFTVSPVHKSVIEAHMREFRARMEEPGTGFDTTYSIQAPSTDTIAVEMTNRPFRDRQGRLLFRPGGHGALLKNVNDIKGDIVFIKNIDNVVPERLNQETVLYKKALGGYLVELQNQVFGYLEKLTSRDPGNVILGEMFEFLACRLSLGLPADPEKMAHEEKRAFLISRFNRPLRVCGMVRNVGEPGGGPFWVEQPDGALSPQIIESSQVDMESSGQRNIWESSTHFNPVDLVCGVRDYLGKPFDLFRFRDPDTGFISIKSKDGRDLKAMELPGLWNGSMAAWNTVFVEVPETTFNPVKTVFDLLRREHQPG